MASLDSFFNAQASASVDIKLHATVVQTVKALVQDYQENYARYQALQQRTAILEARFKEVAANAAKSASATSTSTAPEVKVHHDNSAIDALKTRLLSHISALENAAPAMKQVTNSQELLEGLYRLFSIDKQAALNLKNSSTDDKLAYIYDLPVFTEVLSCNDQHEVIEQMVEIPIRVPVRIVERVVQRPHQVIVEKVVERPPQVVMMDKVVEKPVTEVHHQASPIRSVARNVPVGHTSPNRSRLVSGVW
jgi:hypothetical protein